MKSCYRYVCFSKISYYTNTCKKSEWWDAGMVMCLGQGADLHMAQLMPLPLNISCSSKSRLVLPFWCWLTQVVPDKIRVGWKLLCVCVSTPLYYYQVFDCYCKLHVGQKALELVEKVFTGHPTILIKLQTHTCTHTFILRPYGLCPGLPGLAGTRTNLDFTEARESEWLWQICTSPQTDNHANTPPLSFLQARCSSCHPNNSTKALKAALFKL